MKFKVIFSLYFLYGRSYLMVLFDISLDDVNVTSIAALNFSSYMVNLKQNRRHLTTMSFN